MKRTEFKVGDKVWSMRFGWGKVNRILRGSTYPVFVFFSDNTEVSYTADGRVVSNSNRTLFFEEIQIPKSAYYTTDPDPVRIEMTADEALDFIEKQKGMLPGTLRIKKGE